MKAFYKLKLFDKTLVKFSLEDKGGLKGLQADDIFVEKDVDNVLPIGIELTPLGIVKWLKRRVIPKNRTFVYEILKSLNLEIYDTKGIIDVCKGLSLNDCYWVVPENFDGMFSDYNLYQNSFSEILSLVAYTGVNNSSHKGLITSPELTTNGMLPKAWRALKDGIYLYKGGTTGFANTGNEPYSEYYASQIAKIMSINHVSYDLEKWKGILASKCKIFTDINTAYVPIGVIDNINTLQDVVVYYEHMGEEYINALSDMLVFDAVIYNEDRHFGNFGLLRENHSGKFIAPAPIFDNGVSLFNFAMKNEIENLSEYAVTRSNPYGLPYQQVVKSIITKRQKEMLRNLIGFKFTRHRLYNLPEERLIAIEKQIASRVTELISL
ncbi:MAG: XRE family transcriptional regulator [Acutalibacteraceae bacterium]|nr:XRE family transcriptional regulator [Acutalibacteraceae bacterium]